MRVVALTGLDASPTMKSVGTFAGAAESEKCAATARKSRSLSASRARQSAAAKKKRGTPFGMARGGSC
jgi:hypothetical protein